MSSLWLSSSRFRSFSVWLCEVYCFVVLILSRSNRPRFADAETLVRPKNEPRVFEITCSFFDDATTTKTADARDGNRPRRKQRNQKNQRKSCFDAKNSAAVVVGKRTKIARGRSMALDASANHLFKKGTSLTACSNPMFLGRRGIAD